mgnify:CR=1 FL=1
MKFNKNEKTGFIDVSFEYDDVVQAYSKCENDRDKFKAGLSDISDSGISEYLKSNGYYKNDAKKLFGDMSEQFEKLYSGAKDILEKDGIYMKYSDSDPYLLLMDVHKDNFVEAVYNNSFLENSSEKDYDYYIKYTPTLFYMDGNDEIIHGVDIAVFDKTGVEKPFTADTFDEGDRGKFRVSDYFVPVKENDIPFGIDELDLMESVIETDDEVLKRYYSEGEIYAFDDLYKLEVSEIEDIVSKAKNVKSTLDSINCDIKAGDRGRVFISDRDSGNTISIDTNYDSVRANSELYRITQYENVNSFDSLKEKILESGLAVDTNKEKPYEVSDFGLDGLA